MLLKKIYILLIFISFSNVLLGQVNVSIPDTTEEEGKDIEIPIYVSDVTDLKIRSYYFELKYDKSILQAKSIIDNGTISDVRGWDIDGGFTKDGIFIRADGFRYLKGSGVLITIKFEVIAKEGLTDLAFTRFFFNSGIPEVKMSDGSFRVYNEKKIKFVKSGNGFGQVSIDNERFDLPFDKKLVQGVSYKFEAHSEINSKFNQWSGDISSTNKLITYVVTNSAEIIADFSLKTYSISARIEPEGFGQVDGVGVYIHGDKATLVANPYAGKNFLNWSVDGNVVSTELSYTFSVSRDLEIVANFETGLFQVTTNTNPIEAGQTTGAGFYFPDQLAEVTAISNEGWTFVNWTLNDDPISEDSVFSFNVKDNVNLTANYTILTEIEDNNSMLITSINSPYPNPFNPTTTFKVSLAENSFVTLQVLDLTGRILEKLYDSENLNLGHHEKNFNASKLASGVYFYNFLSKGKYSGKLFAKSGKLILMK